MWTSTDVTETAHYIKCMSSYFWPCGILMKHYCGKYGNKKPEKHRIIKREIKERKMSTRAGDHAVVRTDKKRAYCPEYTVASISHSSIKITQIHTRSMANVHIFCPLFSLCTSVPVPLVRIVILMRLTIVMLLPHARLALVSLLPVTFVVLQLVILLTMEGIIRWDVRLPPAVVMMTVMVVVVVPVRCSPVVVDLGLVPVGLV